MGADQNHDWAKIAASALDWWHDAGVDVLVDEAPFGWLDAATPVARTDAPSPTTAPDAPPTTLAAFLEWRAGHAAPDAAWGGTALATSGPHGADVMVLVDCPERGDRECLLEGEAGRLFDNMLRAIGRSRADVRLAAVCARRPTTGRAPRDLEQRLGELARHQVGLEAPRRLLVLGDAATRAILGTNAAEARGRLHPLNLNGATTVHVVASHHPRMLLDRPACKQEAWKDLRMLIEGMDA